MAIHHTIQSSLDAGNRSSLFMSNCHDKRNLWWRAFRQTVLEPHAIIVLDNPMTDKVPSELLSLVEEKCQSLERHEQQALEFVDAIAQGRGFGPSPIFPPDVVPALPERHLARCLEPIFDPKTMPEQEDSLRVPLCEMPLPRPNLVSGFTQDSFSADTYKQMPMYLTVIGTISDYSTGRIQPGRAVYSPFLLFERTYGHAKHEIESAMNYCAMNGASALNAIEMLYETAWPDKAPRPTRKPVVFSCTVDNDLGVINHHWMTDAGFFVAPLCKFDFRDLEHFMHFLAWIEAIEEWANTCLLPDIQNALQAISYRKVAGHGSKSLSSPVSDAEKQEMMSRSMKEAFDNIPWKGARPRNTPLGVTSAMRMRSPKATAEPEPAVTPMSLTHPTDSTKPKLADIDIAAASLQEEEHIGTAKTTDIAASIPLPVTAGADDQRSPGMPAVPPPPPAPATDDAVRRNKSRLGLALRKSSDTPRATNSAREPRPITSAGLDTSMILADSVRTMPSPYPPYSTKSPGSTAPNTAEMRSPAQSFLSVTSKKSFSSLRRDKRVKSPATPDSVFSGTSPKSGGFKSKISNSLGMIKEHTKRSRPDNSAPTSAKEASLPTPMYDKKRFDIKTPKPMLPETPRSITETLASFASTNSTSSTILSQPPQKPATLSKSSQMGTSMVAAEYNAKRSLPLRQWAKSPTSATTQMTTLTAGA